MNCDTVDRTISLTHSLVLGDSGNAAGWIPGRVQPARKWLTYSHTPSIRLAASPGHLGVSGPWARHCVSPWFFPRRIQSEYADCTGQPCPLEAAHVCGVDDSRTQDHHAAKAAAGGSASCMEASHVRLWSNSRADVDGSSGRGIRRRLRGNRLSGVRAVAKREPAACSVVRGCWMVWDQAWSATISCWGSLLTAIPASTTSSAR